MAIHIASVYSIDDRTVADLLGMLGQLPPRRGKKRFCGTLSFSVQQKSPMLDLEGSEYARSIFSPDDAKRHVCQSLVSLGLLLGMSAV